MLTVHVQHEFNSDANTYLNGSRLSICSAGIVFIFDEPSMLHGDNFSHRCLQAHGQILLPDFIDSGSLQFSVNYLGQLNIEADIKGALRVDETVPSMSARLNRSLYDGTTTQEGVYRPGVSTNCNGKRGARQKKKNMRQSCSWTLATSEL